MVLAPSRLALSRRPLARPFSIERHLTPSQALIALFLSLIAIGTVLLSLPIAVRAGKALSWTDALFTATSAVCVTGLTVVDTGARLSLFGQCVVLGLIQAGGLGYMTVGTLIAVFLGKMALRDRLIMQEAMEQFSFENLTTFAKRVLLFTFSIEAAGTLLLWACWRNEGTAVQTLYFSLFHAVSAFCNAGFSLLSDSMMRYRGDVGVNLVLMALIVAGGLGFVVLSDLHLLFKRRKRVTVHTRIALATTGLLIAGGFLFLFLTELPNTSTLGNLTWKDRTLASLFQSVTPRTVGFNSIPIENMRPVSLFFIMFLMFVGGCPGGTFAMLMGSLWATLRGRRDINFFGRRMAFEMLMKSFTVGIMAFLIIAVLTLLLLELEGRFSLIQVLFETTSAFGTVGLSMGITPLLSTPGKLVITAAMFIGRLGPLVVGTAVLRDLPIPIRYAEEKILVG
jgi:trk system potassium uptake protein